MPGQNVRSEQRDGMEVLYAKIDGVVRIARGVMMVKTVVRFKGDVNQNVGTVEKDKDVFISGSVGPNFAINAGGSVTIDGVVKAGATIRAQEDVIATKGIVGSQTRVVSLGNVETSFVQGSSVVAYGAVSVGSHLSNARVRAGGQITVGTNGGERSGSITGGQVYSSTGIEADKVRGAVLGVGPGLEIVAQLRKLDESINFCKTNVLRIFRTLKLKEIDVVHFKAYIESCSPEKRTPMIRILEQLKSLAATRDQFLKKRQELKIEQERKLEEAEINISGHVSAGVLVRMGDETLTATEELPGAAFHKTVGGISWSEGG